MPEARSARKGTLRRGMKMGSISDLFKPNVENLKAKRDIKGLVNELQNTASSKTRLDAATALNELGWKPASDTERSYYLLGKQAWSELATTSGPALKLLVKQLQRDNPQARMEAARYLGEIGAVEAIEPLLGAFYGQYPQAVISLTIGEYPEREAVVQSLLQALAKIGKPAVEPFIRRIIATGFTEHGKYENGGHPVMLLMGPSSENIHAGHARLLGRMGDLAFGELIRALSDPDSTIRRFAAFALGETKDRNAVGPLVHTLLTDKESLVRWKAAIALGQIGDASAVGALVQVLEDEDAVLRSDAEESLGKMGETAVEPLIQILRQSRSSVVRSKVASSLGLIGDARAVEPLILALQDKDRSAHGQAAEALGRIGGERAVAALTLAAKQGGFFHGLSARAALGAIKDRQNR
jgi:HEAT repeat protein